MLLKDCDFVMATSGIWRKGKANISRTYLAEKAVEKSGKLGDKSIVVALS